MCYHYLGNKFQALPEVLPLQSLLPSVPSWRASTARMCSGEHNTSSQHGLKSPSQSCFPPPHFWVSSRGVSCRWDGPFCTEAPHVGKWELTERPHLCLCEVVSPATWRRLQGREVAQEWRKGRLWRACTGDVYAGFLLGRVCMCQGCRATQRQMLPMEPWRAVWTSQHPLEHAHMESCLKTDRNRAICEMPCQTSAWGCMLQTALFLVYFIASKTAKSGLSTVSDFSILPVGWAKRSWGEYWVDGVFSSGLQGAFQLSCTEK